jgi:glycosyltransferase involved in cell wall biosynthesis
MTAIHGDWPQDIGVTPSFNQGLYIEATIMSVLEQGYPTWVHHMDGGSTDGTVEIIEKYSKQLTYW